MNVGNGPGRMIYFKPISHRVAEINVFFIHYKQSLLHDFLPVNMTYSFKCAVGYQQAVAL